jgi:Ser-tRNA(Ala) deacylase AlaX
MTAPYELPPTTPLYHRDPAAIKASATVLSLETIHGAESSPAAKWGTHVLILDQTIFYPQGGGQPSDTGSLLLSGNLIFNVAHAVIAPGTGVISHYGTLCNLPTDPAPQIIGATVQLEIDAAARKLNTRIHTAGHLLDYALQGVLPISSADSLKGYHFPAGPYVEYRMPSGFEPPQIKALLEEELAAIDSSGGLVVHSAETTVENAVAILGSRDLLGEKALLAGSVRIVRFTATTADPDFSGSKGPSNRGASACAGTHVPHTKEIGPVRIRKVSSKAGVLKISYTLD